MKNAGLIVNLFGLILSGHAAEPVQLVLSAWVSDHMMLPSNRSVPLSGCAAPSTVVTVEFANQKKTAVADSSSHWNVILDSMPASSIPNELIVSVNHQSEIVNRKFADVLIGDIWICSGQSNMLRPVSATVDGAAAAEEVQTVDVRFFNGKEWIAATSNNIAKLQAVPFFFAAELARSQQAPVGVFVVARGGTGIEAWVPAPLFPDTDIGRRMRPLVSNPEVLQAAQEDQADFRKYGEHRLARWGLGRAVPSMLFEELVKPFGDLPVCGVLWYQGESNADTLAQAKEYDQWLERLILAYRSLWNDPCLPFVIIQLPEYDSGCEDLREAWTVVQKKQADVVARTDQAVLVEIKDLGDLNDIHPRRKKEVGWRAATAVRNFFSP